MGEVNNCGFLRWRCWFGENKETQKKGPELKALPRDSTPGSNNEAGWRSRQGLATVWQVKEFTPPSTPKETPTGDGVLDRATKFLAEKMGGDFVTGGQTTPPTTQVDLSKLDIGRVQVVKK